jgi:hypothetical protein
MATTVKAMMAARVSFFHSGQGLAIVLDCPFSESGIDELVWPNDNCVRLSLRIDPSVDGQ